MKTYFYLNHFYLILLFIAITFIPCSGQNQLTYNKISYTFLKKDTSGKSYTAGTGILGVKYPTLSIGSIHRNKKYIEVTIIIDDSSFTSLNPCIYDFKESSKQKRKYFEKKKFGCFNSQNNVHIKLKYSEKIGFLIYPVIKDPEVAYIVELLDVSPIYKKKD